MEHARFNQGFPWLTLAGTGSQILFMRILLSVLLTSICWLGSAPLQAQEPPLPTLATPPPLAPLVPNDKLRAFLPEPPEGWSAEKAEGSTTETDEIRLSSAQRTYFKGTDEDSPSGSITIIDSTNNLDFFNVDRKMQWESTSETEEGYDKKIEIGGMRAIEHYNKAAKTGSLSVFVGNRYFVQIELTNVDPKELRAWLKRIDTEGLAKLK